MTNSFTPTKRTKIKRGLKYANYDRQAAYDILDATPLCHIGGMVGDHVMVQPNLQWRMGDQLMVHGSSKNGLFKGLKDGGLACISVSILDALVLAKSAFHHSVNARSVIIYGKATLISDRDAKMAAMKAMLDKIVPDRWEKLRPVNEQEFKATDVLAFDLNEVSVKIRTGGPVDDEEDANWPVDIGLIPVSMVFGKMLKM